MLNEKSSRIEHYRIHMRSHEAITVQFFSLNVDVIDPSFSIYQLDSREEARKDAEKVDIDEIGQMTEDKKEALKKWRAAEAELSDHS